MTDKNLENLVSEYADLAKDKNIDTAALLMNALQQSNENKLSPRFKKWSYLISIGVPPLGLLIALWLFFRDETDAKSTAYVCIFFTAVAILGFLFFSKVILNGSGLDLQQIQQIQTEELVGLSR